MVLETAVSVIQRVSVAFVHPDPVSLSVLPKTTPEILEQSEVALLAIPGASIMRSLPSKPLQRTNETRCHVHVHLVPSHAVLDPGQRESAPNTPIQ